MASHDPSTSPEAATIARPTPRWAIHRRLYDWVLGWAESPHGVLVLVAIAFIESSVFPIPPDVLLIPLVLACPTRWWRLALWCTIGSVVGGMFGYGIGSLFWEPAGVWIVTHLAHVDLVEIGGRPDVPLPSYLLRSIGAERLGGDTLFRVYDRWNAWIVFIFGLTPLPYKLVTITAGLARVDLPIFVAASVASRGLRFAVVALIVRAWGPPARLFIERYFNLMAVIFVLLLIGGFALVKFVL